MPISDLDHSILATCSRNPALDEYIQISHIFLQSTPFDVSCCGWTINVLGALRKVAVIRNNPQNGEYLLVKGPDVIN